MKFLLNAKLLFDMISKFDLLIQYTVTNQQDSISLHGFVYVWRYYNIRDHEILNNTHEDSKFSNVTAICVHIS